MTVDLVAVLIPLSLLIVLMVCETPVAFSLGISGAVGIVLLEGVDIANSSLAAIPYSSTAIYTLTLVPMFVLMGLFVSHSGLLEEIFDVAHRWTRRLPGGLGMATVVACTFFGGVTGASVADSATLGRLSIGQMSKRGYEKSYAAGIVAAAGTVATLIPPSIGLVIYAIITNESVGRLLLAGIVPGALSAGVYIATVYLLARRGGPGRGAVDRYRPSRLVIAGGSVAQAVEAPRRRVVQGYVGAAAAAVLFLTVIGGIYSGVFTATEAGAVGAFVSLVLSSAYLLYVRHHGEASTTLRRAVAGALTEAGALTAMVFALIVGAAIFTQYLILAGIPTVISEWILGLPIPATAVVALFLIAMIPLGMFIDGLSMLLIVGPLAYPIVSQLGFDGAWFGVLLIKLIEIGLITPPVGLNAYVVAGLFDDLQVELVFRRVLPFLVADVVVIAILFLFPQIVTFLPDLAPRGG